MKALTAAVVITSHVVVAHSPTRRFALRRIVLIHVAALRHCKHYIPRTTIVNIIGRFKTGASVIHAPPQAQINFYHLILCIF